MAFLVANFAIKNAMFNLNGNNCIVMSQHSTDMRVGVNYLSVSARNKVLLLEAGIYVVDSRICDERQRCRPFDTLPLVDGVGGCYALLGLVLAAEHVDDLVLVELLHVVAGRAEIFARVKFAGLRGEYLAHCGGHGQTAV